MSLKDFKISDIPEDKSQIKEWLKSELDKFVTTLRTSAFNIDEYESFLKDVSSDIADSILVEACSRLKTEDIPTTSRP